MATPNGIRLNILVLFYLVFSPSPSQSLENARIAYPSMSSSVLFLTIAQKEGYLNSNPY